MEIGRWYESQHLYAAAIGRFQRVVDDYQTTNHVPEALHRLTEIYLKLGLPDEAQRTAAVLGYNYPGQRVVRGQLQPAGRDGGAGRAAAGAAGARGRRRASSARTFGSALLTVARRDGRPQPDADRALDPRRGADRAAGPRASAPA